ncbi:hypothetical protein FB446DRAFT_482243 [Lentinula raphanica]|nr:hypothetical protein FB446DRAFT_482243 [Lentinula raphanica]
MSFSPCPSSEEEKLRHRLFPLCCISALFVDDISLLYMLLSRGSQPMLLALQVRIFRFTTSKHSTPFLPSYRPLLCQYLVRNGSSHLNGSSLAFRMAMNMHIVVASSAVDCGIVNHWCVVYPYLCASSGLNIVVIVACSSGTLNGFQPESFEQSQSCL